MIFGVIMDSIKSSETNELISAVKRGEGADEAFTELVLRYSPLIRKRVNAYFGNAHENSEAIQEARIALHDAARTYDSDKCDGVTFGLYAEICISNRLKSLIRKNSRNSGKTEYRSQVETLVAVSGLEAAVAARDICERVMKTARAVLSDFEYEVFRLSFERYSTKDIANALEKTPKSIDNAKFRISRRLRENKEICDILSDI